MTSIARSLLTYKPRDEILKRQAACVKGEHGRAPRISYVFRPKAVATRMRFSEGALILGSANGLHVLEAHRGQVRWERKLRKASYDSSFSLIDEGHVYLFDAGRGLLKLKVDTGEEIWRFATEKKLDWGPQLSGQSLIFALQEDGCFYGVDLTSGKVVWKIKENEPGRSFGRIVADTKNIYFIDNKGQVCAVSSENGKTLWRRKLKSLEQDSAAQLFAGGESGRLYVQRANRQGFQVLSGESGDACQGFEFENIVTLFVPGFACGGKFDFASNDLVLSAFEPSTGRLVWKTALPFLGRGLDKTYLAYNSSWFRVINDKVYFFAPKNELRVLDQSTGREIINLDVGEDPLGPVFGGESRLYHKGGNQHWLEAWDIGSARKLWKFASDDWDRIFDIGYPIVTDGKGRLCFVYDGWIYVLEDRQPILPLGDLSPKQYAAPSAIADCPHLPNREFQTLIRSGSTSFSLAPDGPRLSLTLIKTEAGPDNPNRTFELCVFDSAGRRKIAAFRVKISQCNLAEENLIPTTLDPLDAAALRTDEQFCGSLDLLMIDTALRILKEQYKALGFVVNESEQYPPMFWHERFGAVTLEAYLPWIIPLNGSVQKIVAAAKGKKIEDTGPAFFDD